jgi:hypothetical protein
LKAEEAAELEMSIDNLYNEEDHAALPAVAA